MSKHSKRGKRHRPAGSKRPARSAPRRLVRIPKQHEGTLALVAAIISLLVHAAVVMAVQGLPLFSIDIVQDEEQLQERRRYTARREDLLLNLSEATDRAVTERMALAALTDTMLSEMAPTSDKTPEPPTHLREVADELEAADADSAPPADWLSQLPEGYRTELLGRPDVRQPSNVGPFVVSDGTEGAGGRSASADAKSILSAARLTGVLPAPPPEVDTPKLVDNKGMDQRLLEPQTQAPPVDFAAIALAPTTALNLPENLDNDFTYRVTVYQPGVTGDVVAPNREGFFRVDITAKRSLHRLKTMPKDVIFLIDTSGSISQRWVEQIIAGVGDALNTLNEGDRFNIVFFDEQPRFFSADRIVEANNETLKTARDFLTSGQSRGYTDVNRALSRLLVRDLKVERVYSLLFISDGVPTRGVMDTRELINLITRDNDLVAGIYCVGVGSEQNKELLDFLSYRNKGFSVYAQREKDVPGHIRSLASRLRYPILKDVEPDTAGAGVSEIYPTHLPDIHQAETFTLYGRFDDIERFTMRITGQNREQAYDFTFSRALSDCRVGDEGIARDWAFVKLHHLYSEMIRRGEDEKEKAEIREQIEALSKRYRLKLVY